MFEPRFNILPAAQKVLWPELAEIPKHFVLYGGTGLALRLGHRGSVDFDFFSSEHIIPSELLKSLTLLRNAKILQNVSQTLTVQVDRNGPVKLSFFAELKPSDSSGSGGLECPAAEAMRTLHPSIGKRFSIR